MKPTHVIVSEVYVGVADPTVLDVEGDVLGPSHVPLDRELAELGVLGEVINEKLYFFWAISNPPPFLPSYLNELIR